MKKNLSMITFFIFLVFSVLLASCSSEPCSTGPTVRVTVNQNSSRAARPDVEAKDFTNFKLFYSKTDDLDAQDRKKVGEWNSYDSLKNASFNVDVGTYYFRLYAICDSLFYEGVTNSQIVDGENNLSFTLRYSETWYNEGSGSFNLKLSFPNDNDYVKCVTASLCNTNMERIIGYSAESLDINAGGSVVYSKENVASGNYIAVFSFYGDSERTLFIGSYMEYVNIANGLKSSSENIIQSLGNIYSITLNYKGGSLNYGLTAPASFTRFSDTIFLPTEKEMSYVTRRFAGWYTSEDFSGDPVTTIPSGSEGNKVFYAKWIEQVTITFSANGGAFNVDEQTGLQTYSQVVDKGVLTALNSVESMGLKIPQNKTNFLGWAKTTDANSAEYADSVTDSFTSDLTLYAIYSIALNPSSDSVVDTDGDGLTDYQEINQYHTDPFKKDTDGDGWSDKDEVGMYQSESKTFHPLIADLPAMKVELTDKPQFKYVYNTTVVKGKSENFSTTNGTVHSKSENQSNTDTSSLTHGWGISATEKWNLKVAEGYAGAGFEFSLNESYHGSITSGESFTYGRTDSQSNSQSITEGKVLTESESRTITGGKIILPVKIVNPSAIGYHINSITFAVNKISSGKISPITSIVAKDQVAGVIAPGQSSNTFNLSADVSAAAIEDLMKYSNGVTITVSNYDISISDQTNPLNNDFSRIYTTTAAQTARIKINYGPGNGVKTETYYVATKSKYNTAATTLEDQYEQLYLDDVLETIGFTTSGNNPNLVLDNGKIKKMRTVTSNSSHKEGDWYISRLFYYTPTTRYLMMYNDWTGNVPDEYQDYFKNYNIGQIPVNARDEIEIFYDIDKDEDGVPYNEELLYGSDDTIEDTDGDDLSDYKEIYGWKKVINGVEQTIYTNPILKDSDGDDLDDNEDDDPLIPRRKNDATLRTIYYKTSEYGEETEKTFASDQDSIVLTEPFKETFYLKVLPKLVMSTYQICVKQNSNKPKAHEYAEHNINEPLDIQVGDNYVWIKVTAPDEKTSKEYKVVIKSDFNDLNNYSVTKGAQGKAIITWDSYKDKRAENTYGGYVIGVVPTNATGITKPHEISSEKLTRAKVVNTITSGFDKETSEFFIALDKKNNNMSNGSFTIDGMGSRYYVISLYAYSESENLDSFQSKRLGTAGLLTAKSSQGTLTFYPQYFQAVDDRDGGWDPDYYWTFSSSEFALSSLNVDRGHAKEFDDGDKKYWSFQSDSYSNKSEPSEKWSKKFTRTFVRGQNNTASIKFQCWEKDYSSDDDNLGANSIQFVYDYTSDSWNVTSDNKSVTIANSGLNGKKKGELTIDDSDGKVKLVYYVSWE